MLDAGLSGMVVKPACGGEQHVLDLFSVDAELRWSVGVGAAGFEFNKMNDILFSGDDIDFVTALTPVALQDVKAVGGQPVDGQCFSYLTGADMWHHPCNLSKEYGKRM